MNDEAPAQIREMQAEIREMRPATREARTAMPWIGFIAMATVPGLVLALIGPFGSFLAPLWARLAYWMPTMTLGALLGAAITIGLDRLPQLKHRPLLALALKSVAMTAIMVVVASAWGNFIFGPGTIKLSLQFAFYVWLVTVTMMAIATAVEDRAHRISVAASPLPSAPPPTPATLLARLPEKLKTGAILALQGEDHYVRVHTTTGADLILIRLSDAIDGMGDTPGARTHRSWWVAKRALKSIRRDNGKISLVLENDLEVPVSRGYASELKEAGWLDR